MAELSSSIPALARDISEGQSFVSKGPGGSSRGRIKQGSFIVSAEKLADGSLIQPTNHGRNSIKKKLEKEQRSEIEIKDALYLFDSAQENTQIMLSPTLEAIKWTVETIEPSLDGAILNPIAPLKSAFEFLALHLGTAIYDNNTTLTEVRSALIGNPINDSHIKIERLHAPIAKPFHGLLFEGNDPYAKIQVRLFGKLAFRVHFLHLSVGGSRYMYTHDLSKNTEDVVALDG